MLEVNSYELINKCSIFVLFDLIRKCDESVVSVVRNTHHSRKCGEKVWQRSDYRESTATTENRLQLQRPQRQPRQQQP